MQAAAFELGCCALSGAADRSVTAVCLVLPVMSLALSEIVHEGMCAGRCDKDDCRGLGRGSGMRRNQNKRVVCRVRAEQLATNSRMT